MRRFFSTAVLALLAAAAISPRPARAATSCAETDLTKAPDSPMNRMPYANQASTPTCYLHTGTFLVDWYRFTHGYGGGPSSLLHLGYHTHKDVVGKADANMEPAEVFQVVDAARKAGVCDERLVNAYLSDVRTGETGLQPEIQFLQIMQDAKSDIDARANKPYESSVFTSQCARWADQMFQNKWLAEKIEAKLHASSYDAIYDDLLKVCGDKPNPLTLPSETFIYTPIDSYVVPTTRKLSWLERLKTHHPFKNKTVVEWNDVQNFGAQSTVDGIVQSLTAANPQPVGASYCAEVLHDSKYRLVGDNSYAADCSFHASVIVGSRMHDGKCELLLHNSWGNDYWHAPEWQEQRDKQGALTGLWIDADAFARSSYILEHL